MFRFGALQAVILNKAMSLVVVASALPFRAATVPFSAVAAHWSIIVNLLAGSLIGAWCGASGATRLASHTLYRVIAVLLVVIAAVLLFVHDASAGSGAMLAGAAQMVAGVVAGFVIGVVAALLGVAGGLPTMIVGFTRYSRDRSFVVLGENRIFVTATIARRWPSKPRGSKSARPTMWFG